MHRLLVGAVVALLTSLALAPAASAVSDDIVISEFRTRGTVGGNDEFIEIRNMSAGPVSIAGWRLQGCASGDGVASNRATVPAGVTLAAGQSYLFTNNGAGGYSGTVTGDQTYSTGITDFASNNNAGIRVVDSTVPGAVVDSVGSPISPCHEGIGFTTPGANGDTNSFERIGGVQDTDDNVADFQGPKAGNPQNRALTEPPTPDDDAPALQSSTPAGGAIDVPLDSSVSVTFSEPVTAPASAFALACASSGAHTVGVSGGSTTYTVDPAGTFARGESCTLTISAGGVSDVDTDDPPDTMAANATVSFTTLGQELRIREIQGVGHVSPHLGTAVSNVEGVVIARRNNGFFMQDPQPDADEKTSEGLFVFTSSRPRDEIAVGKAVKVSGTVTEFRGAANALGLTQISGPTVTVVGDGAAIAPTLIGDGGRVPPNRIIDNDSIGDVDVNPFFDPKQDGIDFYESVEGMLVRVNRPYVVGPTASFGEVPVVADGGKRAGPFTERGGLIVTEHDFNPERMHLDDEVLRALSTPFPPMPIADVGDTISDVQAVVDYSFGNFKLQVTSQPSIVKDGGLEKETTQTPRRDELAVGSFNVENLTPLGTNPSAAQQAKYQALAQTLVDRMKAPDIVAVEEIQDNNGTSGGTGSPVVDASQTWGDLIAAVDGFDGGRGPTYEYRQIDPVAHQDGGAPGGNIRVGFLFRTDRGLDFVDRGAAGPLDATQVVDANGGPRLTLSPGRIQPTDDAWLASRKPLAGEFRWRGETVIAVANHFASKGGDDPLFGHLQPPVRHTEIGPDGRHRQATLVNQFVREVLAADKKANVLVLGDINDFDFSETTEILESRGALTTLYRLLPKRERYSYVFEGNSQVLDQILVSPEVLKSRPEFDSVHINAEFADQTSDHDPQVARIELDDHGHGHGHDD